MKHKKNKLSEDVVEFDSSSSSVVVTPDKVVVDTGDRSADDATVLYSDPSSDEGSIDIDELLASVLQGTGDSDPTDDVDLVEDDLAEDDMDMGDEGGDDLTERVEQADSLFGWSKSIYSTDGEYVIVFSPNSKGLFHVFKVDGFNVSHVGGFPTFDEALRCQDCDGEFSQEDQREFIKSLNLGLEESKSKGAKKETQPKKVVTMSENTLRNRIRSLILREASSGLDVETSVSNGAGGSTDGNSGRLDTDANLPDSINSDSTDVNTTDGVDIEIDGDPNSSQVDGGEVEDPSGEGSIVSNGGDLGSINESYLGVQKNDYVKVSEKGKSTIVERGFVSNVVRGTVIMQSGNQYPSSKYTAIALG